jgi:16S rRNA G966 N2-methylase RsmD
MSCDGVNGSHHETSTTPTPSSGEVVAKRRREDGGRSEFDSRTEESSATQYFQFYSYLHQQQNMLQDYQRTATYQRAIHDNWHDFKDRVVMDVGAGSGILSFFAAQAGARRVYAVEASSMSEHCEQLVRANGQAGRIRVITGKVEDVELEEKVDVIVSEPMGYMLVNERMLESFVHARKWLIEGGISYRGEGYTTAATDHKALQGKCSPPRPTLTSPSSPTSPSTSSRSNAACSGHSRASTASTCAH